ncbi:unnamed protein product [Leptidea sinapis]|uniref:WAP domain-containing protein n=1 Tax=Leptidea sinapis TaxID=189913 RepID=A0A5E4Q2X6_9NEOP|nr:unnamed protein product [Leptidea sinapis]
MGISAFLFLACVGSTVAWGGLFNRFSSDMLTNLGYGRSQYRHYPYGQVEPEEVYAEALEGNRIDDGEEDEGGRCLPPFTGRKMGEICNRENQCEAGLMHVCRPPSTGRKQYNEDCTTSSECDISRGLCCIRDLVQHTAGEKRIGVFRMH